MRLLLAFTLICAGAMAAHARKPVPTKKPSATVMPGDHVSIPGFGTFARAGRLVDGRHYQMKGKRLLLGKGKAARPAPAGRYVFKKGGPSMLIGEDGLVATSRAKARPKAKVRGNDKVVRKRPGGTRP
jgi:hypothetical protein